MRSSFPEADGRPLPRRFYERATLRVARDLLGCVLVHRSPEGETAGTIVEVEGYCGPRDRGAHSFDGRRTARNEVMYGPPGHAYVYFTYGMHFCLNAVTRPEGIPQAVLIRALAPLRGVELMRERRGLTRSVPDSHLARGPGNVCRAMGIDRGRNGADLTAFPLLIVPGKPVAERRVARTPRIGIDYAADYAAKPWRFLVVGHPAVSGRRAAGLTGNGR
ncbi:MAG: DNA-3-methyladenine glycosylase [Candidatus Binatia bacterium]